MRTWLAVVVLLPLLAPVAAHAQMTQMKGSAPADIAGPSRDHTLDFRLSQRQGIERALLLSHGMIAQQDVAPNALVGVGLVNLYTRRKVGDARISDPQVPSKKPAVTFVLSF